MPLPVKEKPSGGCTLAWEEGVADDATALGAGVRKRNSLFFREAIK